MNAFFSRAITMHASETDDRKPEEDGDAGCVELPLHITEEILRRISPLESVHLTAVCKPWAATVSERLARLAPHLFLIEKVPRPNPGTLDRKFDHHGYVVSVPLDGAPVDDGAAPGAPFLTLESFVPVRDHLRYLLAAQTTKCIGITRDGRLALAGSRKVFFIDPVTDESQRQDLGFSPSWSTLLLATGDSGGRDAVFYHDNRNRLTLCKEGSKREVFKSLGYHHQPNILAAVNCSGVIYVLHDNGYTSKVDTNATPPLSIKDLKVASLPRHFIRKRGEGYLLESEGELLFVRQLLSRDDVAVSCRDHAHFFHTVGFEVYRLDVVAGRKWVKVETLPGDRSLFVSPDSSFVVRASEVTGCISNCVYFVARYCLSCHEAGESTWGVYSIEEGKVLFEHAFPLRKPGTRIVARWFRPSVGATT